MRYFYSIVLFLFPLISFSQSCDSLLKEGSRWFKSYDLKPSEFVELSLTLDSMTNLEYYQNLLADTIDLHVTRLALMSGSMKRYPFGSDSLIFLRQKIDWEINKREMDNLSEEDKNKIYIYKYEVEGCGWNYEDIWVCRKYRFYRYKFGVFPISMVERVF